MTTRCPWAQKTLLEQNYHDKIWGKPQHDELELFKMLILEGKQAGLSWSLILSRMNGLNEAFDNFNPEILVKYDENKINELLQDNRIIKNKLKINAVINNAHKYFDLCDKFHSLNNFMWRYVDFKQIINNFNDVSEVPSKTELSDKISKDLKAFGFKFVGSTIIYAYMQAIGMVNDHLISCQFR